MKAKIKGYHSPEIYNLKTFIPKKKDDFGFLLQVLVGPENSLGDETFDITVCTPKWLENNYKKKRVVFLRHHLLVLEYDYNTIVQALKSEIENIIANDWSELALKISRIGLWEFEDYQE